MKRQRREPIVLSQMRPFTLFLVLSGCIFVAFCLINLSEVVSFLRGVLSALSPVVAGLVFAYLLNPVASWLERRFEKLMGKRIQKSPRLKNVPRVLASFLAVLLFVGSLTALIIAVFSNVVDGVSTMLTQLPHYVDVIVAKTQRILRTNNTVTAYLRQLSERFSATELGMGNVDTVDLTQRFLSALASGAAGTLSVLYTVVIGFIVAVYLLISKERFIRQWKQVLYAVCKPKTAEALDRHIIMANKKFSTAVLGKLIDSLIIGILCFIGASIIGVPYTTLVSVIIGVTNLIPYFGPIFGAIPCVLLILMESPTKALYFAIFIVILQQFDANILDPKIVGQSIGLPAFWELFACLLGGGLFGITGLIIGVPAFAVIYELVRTIVIRKLGERVRSGEMEPNFLTEKLGIQPDSLDLAGEMPEPDTDSPYVQNLILLEEISEAPEKPDKKNEGQEPQ